MLTEAAVDTAARIRAEADRIMALGESSPRVARDPVNLPMIENWVEAIGDTNPVYTDADYAAASMHGGLVAPPAMTQVWTMTGQRRTADADEPMSQMVAVLEQAGYTSVVATNSDHVFRRYLRLGERLCLRVRLAGLIGPKRTALGEGWFFTTRHTWYSGDEIVATMDFRILKFRPLASVAAAGLRTPAGDPVMRPVVSRDTKFFWDGMLAGELRIQRCGGCGTLRHPPGPMCPHCQQRCSADPGYVVASGTGTVFSYVAHHHPPVPGKRLPLVIALVELDEGVRVLGEMAGVSPDQVSIGMPVRIEYLRIDDDLTLPAWRPVTAGNAYAEHPDDARGHRMDPGIHPANPDQSRDPSRSLPEARPRDRPDAGRKRVPDAAVLPEMVVDVTPTFVVASALATRDFTPVHHDRDRAVANGSKDIFLNILTDTGLVQRFVTQWAGPQSIIREMSIRLGVPCYAGDTLTFSGNVTDRTAGQHADRCRLQVTGRCGLGDHIIAAAVVDVPRALS
jgi:uncharacterized protein